MNTPPIVSRQEWEAARQQLLVKEKALTRSRDALAAERRRMPWLAVDKTYEFDGPKGKVNLLDLFEGRRQLIVYRAFFEPGVFGWPEHACRGCSLGADQVATSRMNQARQKCMCGRSPGRAASGRFPPAAEAPGGRATARSFSIARLLGLLESWWLPTAPPAMPFAPISLGRGNPSSPAVLPPIGICTLTASASQY